MGSGEVPSLNRILAGNDMAKVTDALLFGGWVCVQWRLRRSVSSPPRSRRGLKVRSRKHGVRRFAEEPPLTLRVGDLTFDLANHEVYRSARRIELSARELMLLKVLMREPGRVFTRTELCERVWEHAHEYDTKLVEVFIGRLRKK